MAGQAARRAVVCVERFAHNLDDATAPDNDGALRRALRISRAAPEWLETMAPVRTIASAIKEAGIPARVSRDAGGFVCNHLYFGALQYLSDKRSAIPAVFVHLPVTPEQAPPGANAKRLTPTEAADALRAAAAAILDRVERRRRGVTSAPLFLGVDGGATRCRARLRDADGRALAEAVGAAANIHVDFAAAIAAMRAVVDEALGKAGLADGDRGRIAMGLRACRVQAGKRPDASGGGFSRLSARMRGERRDHRLHRRARRRRRRAGDRRHRLGGDRARSRPRKPSLADAASRSATTDRAPISASMRCVLRCAHLTVFSRRAR